jgi:hypothetical protein
LILYGAGGTHEVSQSIAHILAERRRLPALVGLAGTKVTRARANRPYPWRQ